MITCAECNEEKSASCFSKKSKNKLSSWCKPCHNLYTRLHYKQNEEYYINKSSKQKEKLRKHIQKYKENYPCEDCHEYYPYYVMDFDHLRDKKINVSEACSFKQFNEELEKCELVCSNCHRIRTHKRRSGGETGRRASFRN